MAKKQNNNNNSDEDSSSSIKAGAELPVYEDGERDLVDFNENVISKTKRPVHVRVTVRQGESTEQMLRRFNFAVQDVVQRMRDLQFFEKPSKVRQKERKMRLQQIRKYEG